jgi:hypothetical protein
LGVLKPDSVRYATPPHLSEQTMARKNTGRAWAQDTADTLERVLKSIGETERIIAGLDMRLKPLEDFQNKDYRHIVAMRHSLERAYHVLEAADLLIATAKDNALDLSEYAEQLRSSRLGR